MRFQPPKFYPGWKGVNYCRHFERHIGRPLASDELAIVEALERRRLKNRGIRAIIYDPEPSPLARVIEEYFYWVVNVICPATDRHSYSRNQAVFTSGAQQSRRIAGRFPKAHTRAWTNRSYHNSRGHSFDHILVLDWCTRYRSEPRILDKWSDINRALLPCLPDNSPYSSYIVHTRRPLPYCFTVPTFVYLEPRVASSGHQTIQSDSRPACFSGFYPFLPDDPDEALLTDSPPILPALSPLDPPPSTAFAS